MLASLFTANLLFGGAVDGLIVALLGMGIVLVYRSSRVINFAVGDIGVPAAALLAIMVAKSHWPYWPSLIAVVLVGTVSGAVIELAVIRRLFRAPRVIVLVATIGVAELAQAVTHALPDYRTGDIQASFPSPIASHWNVGSITIDGAQLLTLIVVPLITLGLWWLLGHSRFGEQVRACATNPDLARLTGVNPKLMSTAIWSIAGFLSAIAVILWATTQHSSELVSIGPDTLLLGLTAALIGRMTSFPKTVVGAIVVGILYQLIPFNFSEDAGLVQFLLFMLVLVLVARMRRSDDTGGESFAFAPRVPPVPERLREIWWVRRMPQLLAGAALLFAIALPLVVTQSSRQLTWATILGFAICVISVTVLTGWGGQLSLGQMAFAGVGALSAAAFERGVRVNIGWHAHRFVNAHLYPLPFALAVVLGSAVACVFAIGVGVGALRVKGLLLAVSTLAFAIAAEEYIFHRPIFSGNEFSTAVTFNRGHLGPFDLGDRNRAYYYLVLGCLAVVVVAMSHLRRTGIGRIIIGVRENEPAAAALTVSPTRAKLIAFASGGFIAGFGGALLGGTVVSIAFSQRFFRVEDSLSIVAIAVIGGLGSLTGAITGALWVVGLPAFWPTNAEVPLFTSSIGLLIILLYIPGGFTQIGYWARGWVLRWVEKRLPEAPTKTVVAPPASLTRVATGPPATNADGGVLATHGLTVRFGGLVAVNGVDFSARAGEVVGLIGTNGAGKSTLLNAIGGFLPSTGRVELLGREISGLAAHQRARVGLGRTFQAATLFPELTVRETVELALEARGATPFWGTLLWLPKATRGERAKRAEARELIDFLGLGRYADRFIAELSTGTRRIVELAAVLAVAPRVICLDEPTAGVAQREAEAFGPLIKRVQRELDATLVVVEHDLPLILSISDTIYCLEAGAVIASGAPHDVRNDPRVVASYLGTDERAIQRSNA
ncbi:MAG TPA: ATP-binding cassette domain-containing protein [Acidimicrobiia bacterium]|jgi:ABC-type branched-subunit amino acid transport system ATPase component/ABC-type branched-subunit amino acid transport system permease subunit|nr:ATP-binding cassette domain-containing protein [Acidimicrobiia bacterium]